MTDNEKTVAQTTDTSGTTTVKRKRQMPSVKIATIRTTIAKARTTIARVVGLICVIFALVLAVAVLLIVVKANLDNGLVTFIGKFSDHVDLHFFALDNPIKDFDSKKSGADDIKTALFNYGICALVWLAIGRIADRIIRP